MPMWVTEHYTFAGSCYARAHFTTKQQSKTPKGSTQVTCRLVSTTVTMGGNSEFSRFVDPQLIALKSEITGPEEASAFL